MYFGFIEKQPQNRRKTEVKQKRNRINQEKNKNKV